MIIYAINVLIVVDALDDDADVIIIDLIKVPTDIYTYPGWFIKNLQSSQPCGYYWSQRPCL